MIFRNKLGFWTLTALVVGNMIGSGAYILPSSIAPYGKLGLLAWGITSLGALFLAIVFARISILIPRSGGPYVYTHVGFGEFPGFQTAYSYWIAISVGNAASALAASGYLPILFPSLHGYAIPIAILLVWLTTCLNIFGVRSVGLVQMVVTVIKIIPFLLIIALGWRYFHGDYISTASNVTGKSDWQALTGAMTLTFWTFVGLESATVPRLSVENPRRNIPLATIVGVLFVIVLCLLTNVLLMGIIPASALAHTTSPLADAANIILGSRGGCLVAIGAAIASIGVLNGWTLLQGQMAMAAADNRMFPDLFSWRNRFDSPGWGLCVSALFTSALLIITADQDLISQFDNILRLAVLAFILPYFHTCLTQVFLLGQAPKKLRALLAMLVAILAALYALWVLIGCGSLAMSYGAFVLFCSAPLYIWMRLQKSSRIMR